MLSHSNTAYVYIVMPVLLDKVNTIEQKRYGLVFVHTAQSGQLIPWKNT
jgi:hypothetical protein